VFPSFIALVFDIELFKGINIMVKRIALVGCVIIASLFITSLSSVMAATPTEIKAKAKVTPKRLYLPHDPSIKRRHPARNSNFDLNLGLSLQRNDMPQVQRWYDEGADVNSLDNRGRTFLYAAVYTNRIAQVKFLLQRGARVTIPNKDGNLPIEAAVYRSNLAAVRYLLERGASGKGNIRVERATFLQYALIRGQQQIAVGLIKHGATVNVRNPEGTTLLHSAASRGMTQVVKILLSKNALVNAVDRVGVTPLHEASAKGYTDIMQLLLTSGADINARTQKRWTPLHHAARFGHSQATRLLLRQGAKPFVRNSEGKYPVQLARQLKHEPIIDILTAKGLTASKQRRRAARAEKKRKKFAKTTHISKENNQSAETVTSSVPSQPVKTQSYGISDAMVRCILNADC
jgi:ankyrin repeat protein